MSELEAIIKRQSHPWWKLTLQAAFDSHIKLESRVRELEAERDRLKEEIKEANLVINHMTRESGKVLDERDKLRTRYAALVEAAKKVYRVYNLQNGSSFEMYTPCIDKLKAALAEVKG